MFHRDNRLWAIEREGLRVKKQKNKCFAILLVELLLF
jgi:hypothetical protein